MNKLNELRNPQILTKMLDKSSQSTCMSSEQSSEPKSLDVALNFAGVEKIHLENLRHPVGHSIP